MVEGTHEDGQGHGFVGPAVEKDAPPEGAEPSRVVATQGERRHGTVTLGRAEKALLRARDSSSLSRQGFCVETSIVRICPS